MRVSFSLRFWAAIFCSVILSACGGGGSSAKTSVDTFVSASFSSIQSSSIQSSYLQSSSASLSSVQSSITALGYSQKAIFDDWFYEVTGYPNGFNFFLYLPVTYRGNLAKDYPLLIVLHGDDGYKEWRPKLTTYPLPTGVFNKFLLESGQLTSTARDSLNSHLKDAFVVHPEIPHIDREIPRRERLGWWNPEALNDMVAYLEQSYRIDENRIYVVGASMGGIGTFNYAASNPKKIAAIAPVCGGLNDLNTAIELSGMPIWTFLNYDDNTIPFHSYILPMVNKFVGQDVWELYPSAKPPINDYTISYSAEAGLKPWVLGSDYADDEFNFTLYATGGHNSWDKTFSKDALWDWLFSKTLN